MSTVVTLDVEIGARHILVKSMWDQGMRLSTLFISDFGESEGGRH